MIKHLMKRPRLTLFIYISDSYKIGQQTSVEIIVVRKSVCRVPFVCSFVVVVAVKVFVFFSYSRSFASLLSEQW